MCTQYLVSSPFVLAIEGGVNCNPSSRERLFLRTAYIPFWWRTVSLGTYWYCCGGVLVYTYSSTVYCFFFVSAIETLSVVACHVLFFTTVWISENELRESINIIMMLISAHVLVVLPTDVPHRSPSYA